MYHPANRMITAEKKTRIELQRGLLVIGSE